MTATTVRDSYDLCDLEEPSGLWFHDDPDDDDDSDDPDRTPLVDVEPVERVVGTELTLLQWEALDAIADQWGDYGTPICFDGRNVWLDDVTERQWVRWWIDSTLPNLPMTPVVFGTGICVSLDHPALIGD